MTIPYLGIIDEIDMQIAKDRALDKLLRRAYETSECFVVNDDDDDDEDERYRWQQLEEDFLGRGGSSAVYKVL